MISSTVSGKKFAKLTFLNDQYALRDLPHCNGGVVAFSKSSGARAFFQIWSEAYTALGSERDQHALMQAVFTCNARFIFFDFRWNMLGKSYSDWQNPDVVILHYTSAVDGYLRRHLLRIAQKIGRELEKEVRDYLDMRYARFKRKRAVSRKFLGIPIPTLPRPSPLEKMDLFALS
jgi:hypothetical protein